MNWDHETTRPREWDRGGQWIIAFNGTWYVMLRLIEFKWDFTMRPWDHHVVSCRLVVGAGTISKKEVGDSLPVSRKIIKSCKWLGGQSTLTPGKCKEIWEESSLA